MGDHHLLFKPKIETRAKRGIDFWKNKHATGAKFQYSRNWQLYLQMLLGHKLTVSHSNEPKQTGYSLNVRSRKNAIVM